MGRNWLRGFLILLFLFPRGAPAAPAPPAPPSEPSTRKLLDQAIDLRSRRHYAEMESVAVVARQRLERSARPDTAQLAEALYYIFNARTQLYIFSDSTGLNAGLRCLDLLARIHDPPDTLVFSAHRMLGFTYTEMGTPERAMEHFRVALAVAKRRPDWGPIPPSVTLFNMGNTLANMGQYEPSLAAYREALGLREALHQERDVLFGEIYAGMGMVYEQQGKFEQADRAYQEAIRQDETRMGRTAYNLVHILSIAGAFEFHRGDYARAVDYNQRALQILTAFDPHNTNILLLRFSLAQAFEEMGDVERARRTYEDVLPKLEPVIGKRHRESLYGWIGLASACSKLGDGARARECYAHVERVFAEDSTMTERGPLAAALAGEALLLYQGGDAAAAIDRARRALDANGESGATDLMPTLQALCVEMMVRADRREWADVDTSDARLSRELGRFALPGNNRSDLVWVTRSAIAARRGRHEEAIAAAAEGARQARERLLRNVRALSDRQGLMLSNALSEPLDQLLRVAATSDPISRRRAWDEVVRTRGLVRSEIARRRLPASALTDTVQVKAHEDWIRAQRRLAQAEVQLASSARGAASDSTLAALRSEEDEAERRWARASRETSTRDPSSAIGLDSVLAHLDPGEALVGYVDAPGNGDERRLVAFIARGGTSSIRSIDLGRIEDIAPVVRRWIAAVGEPNPAERSESACRREGALVRARLWDPIAKATAGARDVFLVPDGPTIGIPWGALPEGSGGYLAEADRTIHVLESERELATRAPISGGSGLLAVGGVNYDRETPDSSRLELASHTTLRALPAQCDTEAIAHLPALPATEGEVRDVQTWWLKGQSSSGPAACLTGSDATESALKRLAPGKRALHIATHSVMRSDMCGGAQNGTRGVGGVAPLAPASATKGKTARPSQKTLASPAKPDLPSPWLGRQIFLALADANHAKEHLTDENEGLLTAEEVTTLDLSGVDWVVLSACQTAAGQSWTREGVLGLQRAFHLAGARTVIASEWAVDDVATREWMRALYEARAQGAESAAKAATIASRSILAARRHAGRSTHPFFWAAFTASGE